jgi:hypothetical protein
LESASVLMLALQSRLQSLLVLASGSAYLLHRSSSQ